MEHSFGWKGFHSSCATDHLAVGDDHQAEASSKEELLDLRGVRL